MRSTTDLNSRSRSPRKSHALPAPRVLIVDDSAVVRAQLRRQLCDEAVPASAWDADCAESGIEVIGMADDCKTAMAIITRERPDVVILDVQMPALRGPGLIGSWVAGVGATSVIVLASPTGTGASTAVEALAAGAVDAIAKPVTSAMLDAFGRELIRKIHQAHELAGNPPALRTELLGEIRAFAGSTGCVKPLVELLGNLPADAPATIVLQQFPTGFTAALARYFAERCAAKVREAATGDPLQPGHVLLAPSGKHILLQCTGDITRVKIEDGPEIHHERPSVDLLLRSAPRHYGAAFDLTM